MQCTSCGRTIQPVVAIDIDGTLGDYHGHFMAFAAAYLRKPTLYRPTSGGILSAMYDGQGSFREWFCEWAHVDERIWRDIKLAYRQGGQKRSMPMYPGAADTCKWVRERAELWLTTTRPYLRLDNVDPDTRFWLHANAIEFDGLLYDEFKYAQLAATVDPLRVAAVLDDELEQYRMAESVFGWRVPVLRQTHWNRAVRTGTGARSLVACRAAIEARLNEWHKENP